MKLKGIPVNIIVFYDKITVNNEKKTKITHVFPRVIFENIFHSSNNLAFHVAKISFLWKTACCTLFKPMVKENQQILTEN